MIELVEAPRILVVANPYDAQRITRLLGDAQLSDVHVGDGGDETLEEFRQCSAEVVILTATLDAGDSLALATALRAESQVGMGLVLIGDERGPVRTALDAIEFHADRFLRRPLSANALAYAVRSCKVSQVVGVGGVAQMARRMKGGSASPHGAAVALAQVTAEGAAGLGEAQAGALELPSIAGVASAAGVAAHALASQLDAAMSDALSAFLQDQIDNVVGDLLADAPALPDAEESPVAPSWREPTQILSGAPPSLPAAMAGAEIAAGIDVLAALVPRPLAGDGPQGGSAEPEAPGEAATGTFGSEIRRTMSAIEKRLFGEDTGENERRDELSPEIDLDTLGVETVPGLDARPLGLASATASLRPLGSAVDDDVLVLDPHEMVTVTGERHSTRSGLVTAGSLAEDDVATLLARWCHDGYTGRATFRRATMRKSVFLEEGRPVFALSNLPHDRMGDLLYREGKITRAQHAQSREIVCDTGRRMGETLVEKGFLKRRELLPAVRRHVEDIIYSLFAWESGEYVTTPGETADEKIRLSSSPTALILEGVRRKMGPVRLRQRLGPLETVLAPLRPDETSVALSEADLSAEERRAADLLDGQRSLSEIAAALRLDESTLYPLAYGLLVLGYARVLSARGPAGEAPSTERELGRDAAIDRDRVMAKHAQVVEADYFAVLGVRRDVSGFEIRRAYEEARRNYAVEQFPAEVQRDLAQPLREIVTVLEEAYGVLRDDRVRAHYLQNLHES
jgi:DNA-binding NarL/FixJ family response regulator